MFISLPTPVISSSQAAVKRRPPLTPPSVIPPCVTAQCSSLQQSNRDRCRSPSRSAVAYLARVSSSPNSPTLSSMTNTSALPTPSSFSVNTPTSTPSSSPSEGCHFPFGSQRQQMTCMPTAEGQYISFPSFDELYGDYPDDEEDSKQ
ncbi:hypothetical protein H072_7209 [Dactylellina haptotyla CBS 200.50]|uniref:Uncharacterized protein n=1 Tax=Dactylellina haptotyla (strain CBS 200.50) TaxID=1284197 RepID=S8BI89_DACHA|nr:hypothetical protein H072_7209 [Dactylellina haptotyla CBS 200.50]